MIDSLTRKKGFLHEYLGAGMSGMEPKPDGEIRLGHNAETAFLFSRAVDAGFPQKYLLAANRALDFVVKYGINRVNGSLLHELKQDGSVRDASLYWRCQTELFRALAHSIHHRDRRDFQPADERALSYVRAQFIDPVHGGWCSRAGRPDLPEGGGLERRVTTLQ